mgnify:CR=1 FL=1
MLSDRYKIFSSKSNMMNSRVLSGGFKGLKYEGNFFEDCFKEFKDKRGINNVLVVYFDMYYPFSSPYAYHKLYFSIDGELMEIRDMNPLSTEDQFYVISTKSGKKENKPIYLRAMNFILNSLIEQDLVGINKLRMDYRSIIFAQVDFNSQIIDSDEITSSLKKLFTKFFGDL